MTTFNPDNERIKRAYFEWQKEANRKNQSTIENIRQAIDRYETDTKYQNFKTFNKEKAKAFKRHLTESNAVLSGEPLSKSTLLSTLRHLKDFFKWLAYQKNYRSIDIHEIEYLNLSETEIRIAQTQKRQRVPTIEQIKKVLAVMPTTTEIEQRNRALIAFTLLTGIRDNAIASLCLKHIKLDEELVEQVVGEVRTKASKTIYTYFFPVGEDIKQIVIDWVHYLIEKRLFNGDDPLFPRTKLTLDANNAFTSAGIEPVFWKSANQIRKIFKQAFENAGVEYFAPHSFRKTLARIGEILCKTPEDFKAWSQNLGHEQVLTTFNSYGNVPEYRQGEIIKNLKQSPDEQEDRIAQKVVLLLKPQITIGQQN